MNLKCEKCGHEPAARDCPACDEPAPLWAKFCPHCGAELLEAAGEVMGDRRLCPDGNCIGILDENGRCVICGQG
jgi:predicted amidophosphoribosyltransferase